MFVQKNEKGIWLVVLDRGQLLLESLTKVVTQEKILGGHLSAIGALKNPELGFYEVHEKNYIRKAFDSGDFELISLIGNVSLKESQPYVHAHAALGLADFSVIGGHLFEAEVAVTAEIFITPFGAMPVREMDEKLGLATIQHCRIQ